MTTSVFSSRALGVPYQRQLADRQQAWVDGRVGSGLYAEFRNAFEPFGQQHAQFAPGEMSTQALMDAADKGEVAVAFAGRVEFARVFETGRIEVARRVQTRERVALLDLDAVPLEILCRGAARGED